LFCQPDQLFSQFICDVHFFCLKTIVLSKQLSDEHVCWWGSNLSQLKIKPFSYVLAAL